MKNNKDVGLLAAEHSRSLRLIYLFMFSVFFIGLGWLALLPFGEGFDELSHYSYVQQIADSGIVSVFSENHRSYDIVNYQRYMPSAYSTVSPFDDLGDGITYRKFFSEPLSPNIFVTLNNTRSFVPSNLPSVESQHPPLYYALLAPIYSISRNWNWINQIVLLRSVSWLFAFVGYILGVAAIVRYWPKNNRETVATIAAAWPLLVPMFFSEMARLGNDSLCLLIMGGVWWILMRISIMLETRSRDFVFLGILLGLGALTKAFFIPIAAGIVLFLFFRGNRKGLFVMLSVSLLIGSVWYIFKFMHTGAIIGAGAHIELAKHGGLINGLTENFNSYGLIRGLAAIVATISWGGTFSHARFYEIFHIPLAILLIIPFFIFLVKNFKTNIADISWAPVLIVSMFMLGLVHHVLVNLALTGLGNNTPGWYLHILAGPLGFVYSLGLLWIVRFRLGCIMFPVFAFYSIGYFAVVSWVQIAMYAGCVAKSGSVKYYAFPEGKACLLDVGRLTHNLSILAKPYIGMSSLFIGIIIGCIGLGMLSSHLSMERRKYL